MTILFASGTAANKTDIPLSGVLAGLGSGLGIGAISNFIGNGYFTNCVGAGAASAAAGVVLSTLKSEKELTPEKPTLFSNVIIGGSVGAIVGSSANSLVSSKRSPFIPLSVGSAILGANESNFDCWKMVVHDHSSEPSNGKLLIEVVNNQNVKNVFMDHGEDLILENVWNEKFKIIFFLFNNCLFSHAVKLI